MRYPCEINKNLHHQHFFFFLKDNKNDMTFWYFSCLGQYCFQPMSMAALPAQAAADACFAGYLYHKAMKSLDHLVIQNSGDFPQ
jgi:hypothetical protein